MASWLENAGDNVLFGIATEFVVALAAGDIALALVIGLDAGELGANK